MNTHSLSRRTHRVVPLLIAVALPLLGVHAPATAMDGTEPIFAQPARIDLTGFEDLTTPLLSALDASDRMGPGSVLIITIPGAGLDGNDGSFGCTANFVWEGGGKLYLGAAGHCFLPADKKATHGPDADYDASGVKVRVCVDGCYGNFRTAELVGTMVELGKVVYARQTDATGEERIGNDFGVVEIPKKAQDLVRYAIPVFGGPTAAEDKAEQGELGCHYGNGRVVGETFPTKARVGMFGGSDDDFWMGDFVAAFGDSGSAIVSCRQDSLGFVGGGAVGVITHLGAAVCPCDVNFKHLKVTANHGVIFGTTVKRAVEMAKEAHLNLTVGLP